ncbi:helix-turn-helix domain-containing protein [Neobacillus drentensis]|uniref:helix-turn-helix domain-containing protein n=1 Tax=Neobacillus drentensis TaxID=220684 RepID=UPI000824E529|nr:helix-turn-helix domain-containing protein [Neobacillus drentensis]
MSKSAYSAEEKFAILTSYLEGKYSLNEITKIYKVNKSTIIDWKYNFEKFGTESLIESSTWKDYSKELKLNAIRDWQLTP